MQLCLPNFINQRFECKKRSFRVYHLFSDRVNRNFIQVYSL